FQDGRRQPSSRTRVALAQVGATDRLGGPGPVGRRRAVVGAGGRVHETPPSRSSNSACSCRNPSSRGDAPGAAGAAAAAALPSPTTSPRGQTGTGSVVAAAGAAGGTRSIS